MNDKPIDIEAIEMKLRVGFGVSWQLSQQVQDIAEKVGVKLIGGSAEAGELFYLARGSKIGDFKRACADAGFTATILS